MAIPAVRRKKHLLKQEQFLVRQKMEVQDLPLVKNKPQQCSADISITYYTDPLCCWSWVFEPVWQQLQTEFIKQFTWRYCMGGLLPGWKNYYDSVNSVSRPVQM